MPKAERLSAINCPYVIGHSLRSVLSSFWTIQGEVGVFRYVLGCNPNHPVGDGEVMARLNGNQQAIFKRDEAFEYIINIALNGTWKP